MGATRSVTSSTFMAGDGDGYERQMGRWSRRLAPLFNKLRDALRLAYLDGEIDGARSYAATAWVVKGRVPEE